MIKLFVSDLDGTLFNPGSQLEPETIRAIRRFQKLGGIFMVATGRNGWECEQIKSNIDNVVYNCANGGIIYDVNDNPVLSFFLDDQTIIDMAELAREYNGLIEFHGTTMSYSINDKDSFIQRAYDYMNERYGEEKADLIYKRVYAAKKIKFGCDVKDIVKEKIIKLELAFVTDEDHDHLYEECKRRFTDDNVVNGGFMNNIELTSKEADKGMMILRYCKLNGIAEDEVAVVGDSGNDVSMLKLFKNSYVVANGSDEAKEVANNIIESNSDFGVARLLDRICDDITGTN